MKLVIVESPSKAKTIQKYLGPEYKVVASGGHVCDLPKKSLGIDIKNNFKPEYTYTDKKKKDLLNQFKELSKKATEIYIATDPDREGEAIGWHIASYLDILDHENRISFDEISKKSVTKAIETPQNINMNLVNAQQARRVIDRLVGYKVSPILSRKIKSGLSGGRVQSAVLKMIVDKEQEIKDFKPEEYWQIFAFLTDNSKKTIKATYYGSIEKRIKIENEETAKRLEQECKNSTWSVFEVKKSETIQKPYAPFSTSTMQQDASIKLGMSSSASMRIAQQLYEGFDVEGLGHIALVTYIRTDSVRISPEFQQETKKFILEKYGNNYVPSKFNIYKNKSSSQDAHEAIRPIFLEITPDSIKDKVSNQQYRLYKLIYDRYLASQMSEARFNSINIDILAKSVSSEHLFKLLEKENIFDGHLIVYSNNNTDDVDNIGTSDLSNLKTGDVLLLNKVTKEQKFTQPPARYTEASLIKAMEDNRIGRPSTYATIISVLLNRKYMEKEKRILKPTQLGELVNQFMIEHFTDIVDINFTAKVEDRLDEIEQGLVWHDVLHSFYPKFIKDVDAASKTDKIHIEDEVSEQICEKCGANMVVKDGRFGKFLACPNYPQCKNIKSIIDPVGICPDCGGTILQKRTRSGKIFYGCSNYPKCQFATWNKPAPILCPKCNSPMTISDGKNSEIYVCTKGTCKHRIVSNNK